MTTKAMVFAERLRPLSGSLALYALTVLLAILGATALIGTSAVPAAAADGCANAEFRTGYSAKLPDCRAYEMAAPAGSRPFLQVSTPPIAQFAQASSEGDGIAWFTYYPLPGATSQGMYYLSKRGSSGWSTQEAIPPHSQRSSVTVTCQPQIFYSDDLSRGVLSSGFNMEGSTGDGQLCESDEPAIVPGRPENTRNLYLWDTTTDTYQLVRVTAAGTPPSTAELGDPAANSIFQAASADFSHVLFVDGAKLTPDAPDGSALYGWKAGTVRLVSVLPDGTPVSGTLANGTWYMGPGGVPSGPLASGEGPAPFTGAVSDDGSRVFFQANDNLYLRKNADQPQSAIDSGGCVEPAKACTVQLDASQGSGPGGGARFQWASKDGSRAFFTAPASSGLTPDTVSGSGSNLYRYDVDGGQLSNLTAGSSAEVLGVSAVSDDGAYAYFVATGVLAPGASAGEPNLYLSHGSSLAFIATLDANDQDTWSLNRRNGVVLENALSARSSPSGRFFAFDSVRRLTDYDNDGVRQIYLFDADSATVRCPSCRSDGGAPTAPTELPVSEDMNLAPGPMYMQRVLLDNGRLFFDTRERLVAGASNGRQNVYQLQPAGVGSCTQAGGCVQLISSGTSAYDSAFYDASVSGDDVFFVSTQDLTGDGGDAEMTIYDARVGGGLPAQAPAPVPCGDASSCLGSPGSSPSLVDPGTTSFAGPGNVGGSKGSALRGVRVARKLVRGATFTLRVSVPGRGRITIAGAQIKRRSAAVRRAGTYRVSGKLTAKGVRALERKLELKRRVRVRFAPATGRPSTTSVSVKFKSRAGRASVGRASYTNGGGAR
jgi:hypothetical protein